MIPHGAKKVKKNTLCANALRRYNIELFGKNSISNKKEVNVIREMRVIRGLYGGALTTIGYIRLCRVKQKRERAAIISAQKARLDEAIEAAKSEITLMRQRAEQSVGEEHGEIFGIYLKILSCEELCRDAHSYIEKGRTPESAVGELMLSEKPFDGGDFSKRHIKETLELLLKVLEDIPETAPRTLESPDEKKGRYIYVSDGTAKARGGLLQILQGLSEKDCKGDELSGAVCTSAAELTAAISLGLPALMIDISELPSEDCEGITAILDGPRRRLILSPDLSELERYSEASKARDDRLKALSEITGRPSISASGRRVYLYTSATPYREHLSENADELSASKLIGRGSDGAGIIFSDGFVSSREEGLDSLGYDELEKRLYAFYSTFADALGKPTVRLFDYLDGLPHSLSQYTESEKKKGEARLFGMRGARLLLLCRQLYKAQLRAVMRSAAYGKLSLLLPYVSSVEEIRRIRALICEVKNELREKLLPFDDKVPLGIELSSPAAVLTSDILAGECDFLVIDCDRLLSLTLAADMSNPLLSDIIRFGYEPLFMLCRHATDAAREKGKPVYAYGKLASDPSLTHSLLECGIERFHLSKDDILPVKERVLDFEG